MSSDAESGGTSTGLTWVQQSGLSAAISKATLTVTASNQSRLYGEANPTFSETITGFANGETASVVTGTGAGSSAAGNIAGVGISTITASNTGLSASNYDFSNLVAGTLTINKAHLTVTADPKSRLYGEANPTLTTTVSGFVNSEVLGTSGVTGAGSATTTAVPTTNVGTAAITAASGTLAASNYDFATMTAGTLTIDKAHLTVTADDKTRIVGQANPVLTGTLSGFVNSENIASAEVGGSAGLSTNAGTMTPFGKAAIVATRGTLLAGNYDFTIFTDGSLTINALFVPPSPLAPPMSLPVAAPSPSASPAAENPGVSVPPSTSLPNAPGGTVSSSGSGSGSGTTGTAGSTGSGGVSVSMVREPSVQQGGIITVSVPKAMATTGSGFSFPLPTQIAEVASDTNIQVTTISGQTLPAWLKYDPEAKTFTASAVPDGAFPMQVVVTIGGNRSTIQISARAE